ncbi:MAG: peptidylprolyl isomerase [Chloroflexi bacterium]|nr:peptidylprolyl isomerase [Chloroflexota bacterium]
MTSRRQETKTAASSRRRQISRRQQERRKQLIALSAIGVFIALIGGIIAYGYATTFVLPPRQMVVQVNDLKYTAGDLVKILRQMQVGAEFAGQPLDLASAPFQVLTSLVDNELLERAAPRLGVTVFPDEIDEEIRSRLLPPVPEGQEVDQAQLEKEFRERYRQYLNTLQLSDSAYKQQVKKDIFRYKATEILGRDVPTVAEQIHLHAISMANDANYEVLKKKFEDGTPFKELAKEFSSDPSLVTDGGDLGWAPRGVLGVQEDLIFGLEVGTLSSPIPQTSGNEPMVFMVSEKAEAREIDPEHRQTLKGRAVQAWLIEERKHYNIKTNFDSDRYYWVVEQIGLSAKNRQN